MRRGAWAEIDLDALRRNYGVVRELTGRLPVVAVVKADAYGHGAVEVSRTLLRSGARLLATAFLDEAVELRKAGIKAPVLVLFDSPDRYIKGKPDSAGNIAAYFKYGFTPVIYDARMASVFNKEAARRSKVLDVHVKLDSGMGRLGMTMDKAGKEIMRIASMKNLRLQGIMSHFSEADLAVKSFAKKQISAFHEVIDALHAKGIRPLCHMANSAAVMSLNVSHMDAVRPGLMLYGYSPFDADKGSGKLTPVMTVKTRVLSLRRLKKGTPISYGRTFVTKRDSLIAVLAIGYADGYSRSFSNSSEVIIKGKRVPVVGRVCMDLTMADVTGLKGVREGQEVVLLGGGSTARRVKSSFISAWELAGKAATIPYEILTSLGGRVERVYLR